MPGKNTTSWGIFCAIQCDFEKEVLERAHEITKQLSEFKSLEEILVPNVAPPEYYNKQVQFINEFLMKEIKIDTIESFKQEITEKYESLFNYQK